jgi:hypothetical protein
MGMLILKALNADILSDVTVSYIEGETILYVAMH